MMGFVLFGFGFEKVIKNHNELSFMDCSVTFWTNIFIRSGKGKHMCTTGSYWMVSCWQDISFIML